MRCRGWGIWRMRRRRRGSRPCFWSYPARPMDTPIQPESVGVLGSAKGPIEGCTDQVWLCVYFRKVWRAVKNHSGALRDRCTGCNVRRRLDRYNIQKAEEMLKRFVSIKGVGPYSNCSPGAVEFRKTSLVFGLNTYGKSTLCEVLRSLEIGDTAGIDARATIPGPVARSISISFAEDGAGEVPLVLKEAAWHPASPGPFRVRVFDTGFVSRNLFAGARAERSNKEALSRFVLGEQGVRQANEIAAFRKQLAETKKGLRQIHEQLKDVGDVDAFVGMKIEQTEAELNEELRPISADLLQKRRSLETYQSIQSRSVLAAISEPVGDVATFEQLNGLLQQSLKGSHDAAALRLKQHASEHMAHARNPEGWINAGLNYASSENCPFCEQPLSNAPEGLIDSYKQYFDEAFNQRMKTVSAGLSDFENATRLWAIDGWAINFDKNLTVLNQYGELADDEVYKAQLGRFNALGTDAAEASRSHREALTQLRDAAAAAIEQKRQAMHAEIAAIEIGQYTRSLAIANATVKAFNEQIEVLNQTLGAFKRKSDKATLNLDITKLIEDERQIKLRLRRLNSNGTCAAYSTVNRPGNRGGLLV
ncbi:MAG: hypothetical protein EOP35_11015 [Rubrivivax sp.]|nr:MAG: hypothetical protein EOP35_11015 [Rubrivivax sp.]